MEPDECDDLIWTKLSDLSPETEKLSIDTKRFIDMMMNNSIYKAYTGKETFTKKL